MGLFKQMKDMKAVVEGSPDLIRAAQEAGVAAQQLAASQAQQIAAVQAAGTPAPAAETLAPIAGVTLERYAEVSRGLAPHAYDVTKAPMVAAGFGISSSHWDIAQAGWNARITSDPAVAPCLQPGLHGAVTTMGFFKSIRDLTAVANEVQRTQPPAQECLAGAMASIQDMAATMEPSTRPRGSRPSCAPLA